MSKTKNHTELTIEIHSTDRAGVRAEIVQHWIKEQPGTPTVRNTYRYNVETLSDGSRIYLTPLLSGHCGRTSAQAIDNT